MSIAAVVVSLPDRHRLLIEALRSVSEQTRPPDDTVIGVDPYRLGEVGNMNRLIGATDCEWLAFLHDDDLWEPTHLEVAERYMRDYDVIVSRFELVGRDPRSIRHVKNFAGLRETNWFPPSAVVARKEVFGEWCAPTEQWRNWVDWTNWNRLLDLGARFVDTGESTMQYRFGDWGNGSWRPA